MITAGSGDSAEVRNRSDHAWSISKEEGLAAGGRQLHRP